MSPAARGGLEPGGETVVDIRVRDADGGRLRRRGGHRRRRQAVLALTGYQLADPIAVFYPDRWAGVEDHRLRQFVLLADPDLLEAASAGGPGRRHGGAPSRGLRAPPPMAAMPTMALEESAMDMNKGEAGPRPARHPRAQRFSPLGVLAENATDADGTAEVAVTLPDN